MKKLIMMLAMMTMTLAANAQFEEDKAFVSASVTGLDLSYNGCQDFTLGFQAKAGYFLQDDLMITGLLGFQNPGKDISNVFQVGVGGRYYMEENGIFLGVNCRLQLSKGYNDFMPGLEVGYSFFLNDKVTIEPAVYYDQSFKNHSDYSTIGLKVGFGYYF